MGCTKDPGFWATPLVFFPTPLIDPHHNVSKAGPSFVGQGRPKLPDVGQIWVTFSRC